MTLPLPSPLILSYEGVTPKLLGPVRRSEPGSAILGRVTLGAGAVLERHAVLRGDGHVITVGAYFQLGVHSTVHIAHGLYGTTVGDHVSVGDNAVVHACTVGDDCVIEDGVCVLDGAVVGRGSVVAAGSVVFPRNELPAGHWCAGVPAVAVRPIAAAERQALHERLRGEARAAAVTAPPEEAAAVQACGAVDRYVAATVVGQGVVRMAEGSSLWFGCVVEDAGPGVTLGPGSNVQDNSVLRSSARALTIGEGCIVGHNVLLHDCSIGARTLVGMGSTLAPGTVVGDDVLLAGGSSTREGQMLEGGWLWAGRPAHRVTPLDERKLQMIRTSAAVYRDYAREFTIQQATVATRLSQDKHEP